MSELTIVGWLWRNAQGPRYTAEHANAWARMIHRNLSLPHRFVLMTDDPGASYDPLIEPVALWDDWRTLKNPAWPASKPQCYVRLKAFAREAEAIFGARFVSMDLDCIVVGSLDPLFQRTEDFLIFRRFQLTSRDRLNCYNASMWMMTAGARAQVWEDFKGEESVKAARQFMGSDQAWIHYKLGLKEPGWTSQDGVYGWPRIRDDSRYREKPPPNARIIFFYGGFKPWHLQPAPTTVLHHQLRLRPALQPSKHQWVTQAYGAFL